MLFGGGDRDQFLGCLTCDAITSDSVCNNLGRHGNSLSATSIWNPLGQYGNQLSRLSPWNVIASTPPAIVDGDGKFYGFFTVNPTFRQRTQISLFFKLLDFVGQRGDPEDGRKIFCQ